MSLRDHPASPRSRATMPHYPTVTAIVVVAAGCHVAPAANEPDAPSMEDGTAGLSDARSAPPFAADDAQLAVMMGQSPSPFVPTLDPNDTKRVEARIAYCLRRSRTRSEVPASRVVLRTWVQKDGTTTAVSVRVLPRRPDLETCVTALLDEAKLPKRYQAQWVGGAWDVGPEPRVDVEDGGNQTGSH